MSQRHRRFSDGVGLRSVWRCALLAWSMRSLPVSISIPTTRVLACEELFRGTISCALVHPREVVKHALAHNAAAVHSGPCLSACTQGAFGQSESTGTRADTRKSQFGVFQDQRKGDPHVALAGVHPYPPVWAWPTRFPMSEADQRLRRFVWAFVVFMPPLCALARVRSSCTSFLAPNGRRPTVGYRPKARPQVDAPWACTPGSHA